MTGVLEAQFIFFGCKLVGKMIINRSRDKMAKNLKDGDVAEVALANLIVRELEDIRNRLDGLARKDLLASVEYLKQGILNLDKMLKKAFEEPPTPKPEISGKESQTEDASNEAMSLFHKAQGLDLTGMCKSAEDSLRDAKGRFKAARSKATEAFSNKSLTIEDRLLAVMIQISATLLERVERPKDALRECRLCIENVHEMPAVQSAFRLLLAGGVKDLLKRRRRRQIFRQVCRMNLVVHDVMHRVSDLKQSTIRLPELDIGSELIDVLSDERVVKQLQKCDMQDVSRGFWSFSTKNKDKFRIQSLTVNVFDQIVVLRVNRRLNWLVSFYDERGTHVSSTSNSNASGGYASRITTDRSANVYVLKGIRDSRSTIAANTTVHVFCANTKEWRESPPIERFSGEELAVNTGGRLFITGNAYSAADSHTAGIEQAPELRVFDANGAQVGRIADRENPTQFSGITAGTNGDVYVLYSPTQVTSRVYRLNGDGRILQSVELRSNFYHSCIAFDWKNELVILSRRTKEDNKPNTVFLTSAWKQVRTMELALTEAGLAVASDGRIVTGISDFEVGIESLHNAILVSTSSLFFVVGAA